MILFHFGPRFPAVLYNNVSSEKLDIRNGLLKIEPTEGVQYWTFGVISYASFQFQPLTLYEPEEAVHYSSISRLQFTVKWSAFENCWSIMDGGIYKDDPLKIIRPSRNGTCLNGLRLPPGNWEPLKPCDRIYMGDGKKIIVRPTEDFTADDSMWHDGWVFGSDYADSQGSTKVEDAEASQIVENGQAQNWAELSYQVFRWLISEDTNHYDRTYKNFLIGFLIFALFAEQIKELIVWVVSLLQR